MLSETVLIDAQVDILRLIPELVTDVGGDSSRIFAYVDTYPTEIDSTRAIHDMPNNSVMVMWRSTGLGSHARREVWKHNFAWIIRGVDPLTMWTHVVNGVPTGGTERLTRREVHPACYPMDTPRIDRKSLFIGMDASIDYYEISVTYTEKGDF